MKFRSLVLFVTGVIAMVTLFSGCSAPKSGLISITPQQYFYSAKEKLEIIDERSFEVKDLDEIIRVFENAEKDAKSAEIIDKSRLYLVLTNTLKARKQYFSNILKGQYMANRPEPFYALDVKSVLETLRLAKKWLRSCEAQFSTESLRADLNYVKGFYYQHKMLTQTGPERRQSLWLAVESMRRTLGLAPDYVSDFRLFGKNLTPREVRLRLIELLAMSDEVATAWELLSEYVFTPANPRNDYPWLHMKGFLLAIMGRYQEAADVLNYFKMIVPRDYPLVEESLWVLEGVYDRLKDKTGEEMYSVEAKIVAALMKKFKGPFSKEKYTTASHLFPRWLPGDERVFEGVINFMKGDFVKAEESFSKIAGRGMLSRTNRNLGRILAFENLLYSGKNVTDDFLDEVVKISLENDLSPILRERIGYLLARYLNDQETEFKSGKLEGEGQGFVKSVTSSPWVLSLKLLRGKEQPKNDEDREKRRRERRERRERKDTDESGIPRKEIKPPEKEKSDSSQDEKSKNGESSSLIAEVYANRKDDWVTSADMHLIALPSMTLIGKGRIVGKEEERIGWVFNSEEVDALQKGNTYLAVFEFANSDSEKSTCGIIFRPGNFEKVIDTEKKK
ncbi:MAG: hypothetical protein HQM10_11885 [Candidatus Riflebacteria bacterium]|nr:hypothetical protein [Candidatus Riflebacteria bacterium]